MVSKDVIKERSKSTHDTWIFKYTHTHTQWMIRWLWWRPLWACRQGVCAEKKDWEYELVCHQTLGSKEMFFLLQVFPILAWNCLSRLWVSLILSWPSSFPLLARNLLTQLWIYLMFYCPLLMGIRSNTTKITIGIRKSPLLCCFLNGGNIKYHKWVNNFKNHAFKQELGVKIIIFSYN
jgi:hypothetical protein